MTVITGHTTRAPGTVLTASIYNTDHNVHITNANALNADKMEGATPPVVAGHLAVFADAGGAILEDGGAVPTADTNRTYIGTTIGGTGDAVTVSVAVPSAGFSLSNRVIVVLVPTAANTGPTTLNFLSTGVKNVLKPSGAGLIACAGGEFQIGIPIMAYYDGTQYCLMSPTAQPGKQTVSIPAGSMRSRTTNGPASGSVETATNKVMIISLDFDPTTQEFAQFRIAMPKGWNESTVTYMAKWSHAATTTNFGVAWQLAAVAVGDDDTQEVAFGSAIVVTDTGGTTDDEYTTAESAALTIAGSPQNNDDVIFQVARVPANGSDTMAIDARLQAIQVFYTTNNVTDN